MTEESKRYIIQPEDILTEQEYQLLQQAEAGELPCPWCERPLFGSFVKCSWLDEDGAHQYYGVRLQCVPDCGFDSY